MSTMAETRVTLEKVLRHELAAVDSYQQAVQMAGSQPGSVELQLHLAEHKDAHDAVKRHVEFFGGDADQECSAWPRFAFAADGHAAKLSMLPGFKALQEGEVRSQRLYEEAMMDEELPLEFRALVNRELLPQVRQRIVTLDRLLQE